MSRATLSKAQKRNLVQEVKLVHGERGESIEVTGADPYPVSLLQRDLLEDILEELKIIRFFLENIHG